MKTTRWPPLARRKPFWDQATFRTLLVGVLTLAGMLGMVTSHTITGQVPTGLAELTSALAGWFMRQLTTR